MSGYESIDVCKECYDLITEKLGEVEVLTIAPIIVSPCKVCGKQLDPEDAVVLRRRVLDKFLA